MHVLVIVNPAAGTARDREPLDDLQRRLRAAGHRVDIRETAEGGDARRFAGEAVAAGADIVVAAGGDGSLNEVLNGVAAVEQGLARCAIGILPVGTGNDFARSLGIAEPAAAVAALVAGHAR